MLRTSDEYLNSIVTEEMRARPDVVKAVQQASEFPKMNAAKERAENPGMFQQKIEGAARGFQLLKSVGMEAKSAPLFKVAEAGLAATQMYIGWSELAAAKAASMAAAAPAAAGAFSVGSALAAASPYFLMATAALTIFGIFKKRKGNNAYHEALFNQMQMISQQVYEMHKDMRDLFAQNFENQRIMYEEIVNGFKYTQMLIEIERKENLNYFIRTTDQLNRLEERINRKLQIIAHSLETISLQPLTKLRTQVETLSEAKFEDEAEIVKKLIVKCVDWLKMSTGRATLPMYTGANLLIGHKDSLESYRILCELLADCSHENMTEMEGFLGIYANQCLEQAPQNVNLKAIFNTQIWLEAAYHYIYLGGQIKIDEILAAVDNQLKFKAFLRSTPHPYKKLFSQYHTELDIIAKVLHESLRTQSTSLGIDFDINKDVSELFTAYKDKKPVHQLVKGGQYSFYVMNRQYGLIDFMLNMGCTCTDIVNLVAQHPDSILPDCIAMRYGTAVNSQYNATTLQHDFPSAYLILEKLGDGKFEMNYTCRYEKPMTRAEIFDLLRNNKHKEINTCITVDFIYSSGEKKRVLQIDQYTLVAQNCVSRQTIQVNQDNLKEAEEKVRQFVVAARKSAVSEALVKIIPLLPKLEAHLRLLKAYLFSTGFKDPELNALKQLANRDSIIQAFNQYSERAIITTPIPHVSTNITNVESIILSKINATDKSYFNSFLDDRLTDVMTRLQLTQSEKNIQDKLPPSTAKSPKSEADRNKQSEESFQQGINIGNAWANSLILAALQASPFKRAAALLQKNLGPNATIIESVDKIPASLKHGLIQAVSLKVMEVMPILMNQQEIEAAMWLTTYSQHHLQNALTSSPDKALSTVLLIANPQSQSATKANGHWAKLFTAEDHQQNGSPQATPSATKTAASP